MTPENSSDTPSAALQPASVDLADDFRRRKKTTLLVVAFTDIADSTALREKLGEVQYERARESFDGQFAEIVERDDGGCIVKGTGDGALVVFDEPSVAVQRALEVQDALGTHHLFRLRIGIDLGQVSVKSSFGLKSDVFGRHVNRAARIQSLAEPGHVLTSFSVYDCAVGWLDAKEVAWQHHGAHPLKGFDNEVSIHESYDPRVGRPQELAGPSAIVQHHTTSAMFSRSDYETHYLPLSPDEWEYRKLDVGRDYRVIEAEPESRFDGNDDPLRDYAERIRFVVDVLKQSVPVPLSIGWIDDWPEGNQIIIDLIRTTGLAVSVNHPEIYEQSHVLVIAAMTSDRQSERVLDTLGIASVSQSKGALRFVYAPASVLATLEDQLIDMGVALATSGMVSLLQAIHQYLRILSTHLPVERIARPSINVASIPRDRLQRKSWSHRLKDLFKPRR